MNVREHIDIDWLITQYLSGTLEHDAFERLRHWSEESESHRKYVRDRLEIWFSSGVSGEKTAFDKEQAFERFTQRVTVVKEKKLRSVPFSWRYVMRIAAVILILLLPFAAYWRGQTVVKQRFSMITVEAPLGARTKMYLPDGTLAWLNAGSKIVYSQGFGVDDRRLELEGECYFEVTHNEKLPFRVNTKELNLRVLGTKFNFCNYPDDEVVTVDLMEGKVALQNGVKEMPEYYLEPEEKIVLDKLTGEMVKSRQKTDKANAWTADELFFDEDSLEEIARKLSRGYNVKMEVEDSLRNKRFYGSFNLSGNTVEKILDVMVATRQLKYKYENDVYILY